MGVIVMRPAFNFEPQNIVTMLTREEWTIGPGTPVVKGPIWFTNGSRMDGTEAAVCGKKAQYFSRKVCKVFSGSCMLSWIVLMKFHCMVDQRRTRVFALTAMWF